MSNHCCESNFSHSYVVRGNAYKYNNYKKLLSLLCQSKPYKLNISKLSTKIEINRNTLYSYLHYLEAGSLTKMVRQRSKGDGILIKPEKLYLNNQYLTQKTPPKQPF